MIIARRKNNIQMRAPLPFISSSPLFFLLLIPPVLNRDQPWPSPSLPPRFGEVTIVFSHGRGSSFCACFSPFRAGSGAEKRQRRSRVKALEHHLVCLAPHTCLSCWRTQLTATGEEKPGGMAGKEVLNPRGWNCSRRGSGSNPGLNHS